MRNTLLAIGLVAVAAAPTLAHANCHSRRVTGAVLGGLGGGALGAALATAPWGFAAAGMGALVGHTIAASTCHAYYRHAYYRRRHHRYAWYARRRYAYAGRPAYGGY